MQEDYLGCTYNNRNGYIQKNLIHEAVHAVQSCKTGKFIPIGWELSVSAVIEQSIKSNLYLNYPRKSHKIEKGFSHASPGKAIPIILETLNQKCKK